MNRRQQAAIGSVSRFSLTGAVLLCAGCTSLVPSEKAVSVARLAVQEAEQSEAPVAAPTNFEQAQRKLTEASTALERGEATRSRRLAEQATVDARVAVAEADYQNAKRARTDLESAILANSL